MELIIKREDLIFLSGGITEGLEDIGIIELDISDKEMDELIIEILEAKANHRKISFHITNDKKKYCPHCNCELE